MDGSEEEAELRRAGWTVAGEKSQLTHIKGEADIPNLVSWCLSL